MIEEDRLLKIEANDNYFLSDKKYYEEQKNSINLISQKMESIGQLTSGLSHEINAPLQYVNDNIEFLKIAYHNINEHIDELTDLKDNNKINYISQKKRELEEHLKEIPEAINDAIQGIRQVKKTINTMKNYAHPGADKKAYEDINDAVKWAVGLTKNEWKCIAETETDLSYDIPKAYCNVGEISQAVLNIIVNAGQEIEKSINNGKVKKGRIEIKTRKIMNYIEISIKDNGNGIPAQLKNKIFEPHFTTKKVGEGTGQGLTITKYIIENRHNGKIRIKSKVGEGTTFELLIPVEPTK